jgi:hypothetical protein
MEKRLVKFNIDMKKLLLLPLLFFSLVVAGQADKSIGSTTSHTTVPSGAKIVIENAGNFERVDASGVGTGTGSSGYTSRTYSSVLTFDVKWTSSKVLTAPITLSLASTGNVEGIEGQLIVDGDGSSTVTFGTGFQSGNKVPFDPTLRNRIYFQYSAGEVVYNIVQYAIPGGGGGGGGGGPTILAQDFFTASNTTDIAGRVTPTGSKTWVHTLGTGTVGIVSNAAQLTSSPSTANEMYFFNTGKNAMDVTWTSGTPGASFVFMALDGSNYFFVTPSLGLAVVVGGSATVLHANGSSISSGDQVRAEVVDGSSYTINVYKGSTLQYSVTRAKTGITSSWSNAGFSLYQDASTAINDITVY